MSPDWLRIEVGGEFRHIGGRRTDIGEFDLSTGLAIGWQPIAPFDGYAVAFGGGDRLYVGGSDAFAVFQ